MPQDDPPHAHHPHAIYGGDSTRRDLGVHYSGRVSNQWETQEEIQHTIYKKGNILTSVFMHLGWLYYFSKCLMCFEPLKSIIPYNTGTCVKQTRCEVWRRRCEGWSVRAEVWGVKCQVTGVNLTQVSSVRCEVWSVRWEVRGVKCRLELEVKSVRCEVWSDRCQVWRVKSQVSSENLEVWSARWEVRIERCEVCEVLGGKCEMSGVKWEVRGVKWQVWSVRC